MKTIMLALSIAIAFTIAPYACAQSYGKLSREDEMALQDYIVRMAINDGGKKFKITNPDPKGELDLAVKATFYWASSYYPLKPSQAQFEVAKVIIESMFAEAKANFENDEFIESVARKAGVKTEDFKDSLEVRMWALEYVLEQIKMKDKPKPPKSS